MKKLVNETSTFGPFQDIAIIKDGYDCDGTTYPYTVVGECQIEDWVGPMPTPVYDNSAANKQIAEDILNKTDWTSIPAVADPTKSNPYLGNQSEYEEYRSIIRRIAVNPPMEVVEWPTEPISVWIEV